MTVDELIAEALADVDLGRPHALKRGRNPRWPYVPVILDAAGGQDQIRARAYATRAEALAAAQRHLDALRASIAARCADRRHRALREQHGLPRELAGLEALAAAR